MLKIFKALQTREPSLAGLKGVVVGGGLIQALLKALPSLPQNEYVACITTTTGKKSFVVIMLLIFGQCTHIHTMNLYDLLCS